MRSTPAAAAILFAVLLVTPVTAQVTHFIDLKVINGSNQQRVNEPVSFGVPVSLANNALTLDFFQIVDLANQAVPSQWKPLSRWGGDRSDPTKPIRWALVSFPATVAANSFAIYKVALGAPPVHGEVYADNQMNHIEVHTTPTTYFKIYKWDFRLFDTAVVNGQPMVTPGRLDMVMSDGSQVNPVITETVLEEYRGWHSTRCVVRQRGQLGQLRFTCRWYFYTGRSDVEVDFRLENPNAYGLLSTAVPDGQVYFDQLYLAQPVLSSGSYSLTTDSTARTLTNVQNYDLRQDFDQAAMTVATDLWTGFSFQETVSGATVGSGNRFKGAIDLKGSQGGVTVTLDRFWQNFPKAFRVQSGEVQVGLFPEWGNGPEYKGQYADPTSTTPTDPMSLNNYRFEGGRWKTGRMVFNFHQGSVTPAAVSAEADRVNTPLIGTAPPSWIRQSGATGDLWIERRPTTDVGINRWERFTDILCADSLADSTSSGQTGFPGYIRKGGTYGGHQNYGWDHFGDLVWADGYCSQHYDWTACFINGFWRTGDYRLYDQGRDVAVSRRDYNQNHGTNTTEYWRGCQFYEKGWWHGNFTVGDTGHNWLEGLLMYYGMTGDESAREACIENCNFMLNNAPKNWTGWYGSRLPGWSIDNLMAAYAYLGNPTYLNEARLGVLRYEQLEQAGGGLGCIMNPANGETTAWMENIFHIAACKYYLATGDATVVPLLNRMRNWMKSEVIILPVGTFPNLTLTLVHEHWSPTNAGNIVAHHNWAMAQSLAYSAICFNSTQDLAYATACFQCVARYWQASVGVAYFNCMDPSTFHPVTFRPNQYPGTESKVLSNVIRWGEAYPAAKALLNVP